MLSKTLTKKNETVGIHNSNKGKYRGSIIGKYSRIHIYICQKYKLNDIHAHINYQERLCDITIIFRLFFCYIPMLFTMPLMLFMHPLESIFLSRFGILFLFTVE